MRPNVTRLSAAGVSPWIPVNRYARSFAIGLSAQLSSNANLTYSVQHTLDDIYERFNCSITRSTTTATLVFLNGVSHGLSVGDWINVFGNGDANLDGNYAVASVVDQSTITYTVLNSGLSASVSPCYVNRARVISHPLLSLLTATADGNYQFPPNAIRLKVSTYVAGYADLNVIQNA